jgi:hypothetical protein
LTTGSEGYPIIELDIQKPWTNPEGIFVVPFTRHEFEGNVYSGIDIRITADPRDINADRLALHKYKDKPKGHHQFVLTMPAIPATHWIDREDFAEDEEVEAIEKGYQATMVAYLGKRKGRETEKEKEQKKKKFLLDIKDENGKPMLLSDTPFVKEPKKKKAGPKPDPMMVQRHYMSTIFFTGNTVGGEAVTNMSTVLSWRLVDMESEVPITQAEDEENEGQDEIDSVLEARMKRRQAAAEAKAAEAKAKQGGA